MFSFRWVDVAWPHNDLLMDVGDEAEFHVALRK